MEKKKKKKVLKLSIAIFIICVLSVVAYFILKRLDILNIEKMRAWISGFGFWAELVFVCTQIFCTIVLCFVPGTSMTFTLLGVALFGSGWKSFLLVYIGIFISSVLMDLIGRFGGSKAIIKLIGQDEYEEGLNLVQNKGIVYVPLMYLLPVFPDDAICMCCGALKIKWWIHYIEILLCRGLGCATMCFGISILPECNCLWDYIEVATIIVVWVGLLFIIARKIEKWLDKKDKKEGN